jgi:hypothetical protein
MFLDGLKKTGKTLEYVPEGGTLRVLLQWSIIIKQVFFKE